MYMTESLTKPKGGNTTRRHKQQQHDDKQQNKRSAKGGVRGYTYDAYLNRHRSNRAAACTYCMIILYTYYRPGRQKKTRDVVLHLQTKMGDLLESSSSSL